MIKTDDTILALLFANPDGLGINELAEKGKIHKKVLYNHLDDLENEDKITRTKIGKKKNSKVTIKLKNWDEISKTFEGEVNQFVTKFSEKYEKWTKNQKINSVNMIVERLAIIHSDAIFISLILPKTTQYDVVTAIIRKKIEEMHQIIKKDLKKKDLQFLIDERDLVGEINKIKAALQLTYSSMLKRRKKIEDVVLLNELYLGVDMWDEQNKSEFDGRSKPDDTHTVAEEASKRFSSYFNKKSLKNTKESKLLLNYFKKRNELLNIQSKLCQLLYKQKKV